MSPHNIKRSHIVIVNNIEDEIVKLQKVLTPARVVVFFVDEFKVEDAKAVINEAYISEAETKFILLCAKKFNVVSQNTLLKVLEEPPKHIEFILVTSSKSALLPTIRSRLPLTYIRDTQKNLIQIDIELKKIDYKKVFLFLKENSRIKKEEAKELVEALLFQATVVEKIVLNKIQLESFERAYKLLELNARVQSVLAQLLMSFVKEH